MAWNGKGYVAPPSYQQQPQYQYGRQPQPPAQGQQQFRLPAFQQNQQNRLPTQGYVSPPAYQKQQQKNDSQLPVATIRPPMTSYHAPEKSRKKLFAGIMIGILVAIVLIAAVIGASGGGDAQAGGGNGDNNGGGDNGGGDNGGGDNGGGDNGGGDNGGGDNGGGDNGGGNDDGVQRLFPEETRSGNNYVGLFLLNEMPDDAFAAFTSAANRWSRIVQGTTIGARAVNANQNFCGLDFPERFEFDHLIIAAEVSPIDGGGGILGQAGPCGLSGNRPFLGTMTFDSADIANLIRDGAVESVILHEMGHVLGIGTLWSRSGILDDAVFQGNQVLVNNQPKMTGANAVAEYRRLTGNNNEQFVPVEDGTNSNGADIISPKANGRGSIDGHWDEDFFPGELMEFRINTRGGAPPMSATTIASLADFGYVVDTSQADAFSVSRAREENLRGSGSGAEYLMIDDILDIPLVELPEDN